MVPALDRRLSRIANRRGLALLTVGMVALLSSAVPYLLYSLPLGRFSTWSFFTTYDESSYLLAADTYASGRLTNPTHEMWRHFEAIAVNHRPSYQSMYPPGQGMFLALGMALTGHAIVGVWITMALACAATCYFLQACFSARWALLGGLLAALHARMALEWGGTYFGGGVAMLGGALMFGGLKRVLNRPRVFDAILLATGLTLLANSRPFEGMIASLPAMVVLAWWVLFDNRSPVTSRITRVVIPILTVLAITGAGMAYYNFRVTGNPWTLPYQLYLAEHDGETPFSWQLHEKGPKGDSSIPGGNSATDEAHLPAEDSREGKRGPGAVSSIPGGDSAIEETYRPIEDSHEVEEQSSQDTEWWFSAAYLNFLTHRSPLVALLFKLAVQWAFYVGPVLSLPLLALLWDVGDRATWFALATVGLTLLAVLTTSGAWPHYLAPVAPLVFALAVQGSRQLGQGRRGRARRTGRLWLPTLALFWLLQLILIVWLFPLLMKGLRWGEARARLHAQLEQAEGSHLVIVRYGPQHTWYKEWVYNKADIDHAKVVWARELSPDSNRRLLDYFHGRHVWIVEPDRKPLALVRYNGEPWPTPHAP